MGGSVIDPPEELVFGAKLQCTGSPNPSFLFVYGDRKVINSLPTACVTDRIPGENIAPFGMCSSGFFSTSPCEAQIMQLAEKWENPGQQNESVNGAEIITTSSVLVCNLWSGRITAVNSGQDGEIAKQWLFMQEMKVKYPGLLEALMNPFDSIYTPVDRHGELLDLLKDITAFEGGSIFLMAQGGQDLLGPVILASIGQLAPSVDVSRVDGILNGLESLLARSGVDNGADAHYLDAKMLEAMEKDSAWYAGAVAKGGFYKWQEEHKMLAAYLADAMNTACYAAIMYASAGGGSGRTSSTAAYEQSARTSETAGAPQSNGAQWNDYLVNKYGAGNVEWVTKSGSNPYFTPTINPNWGSAVAGTLPGFNGKVTQGVLVTQNGSVVELTSGGPSQYSNVSATHVEGKAAVYMRENGITEGTVYHNNTNGTCGYCNSGLPVLLPEGSTLTVVPPVDAVPNNARAVVAPKTFTGNSTVPKTK